MNSILADKNVCIVRDWDSDSPDAVKRIISALVAAGARPYLFDDIISGDRREGFLNNINKADLFVICTEANLIASYMDSGVMPSILNTIKDSGKYVYEVPMSKFLFYQNPQFGGVLIANLVSDAGDMNARIYDTLETIIGDINAKGGLTVQIARAMEDDPTTLPGKLAADAAAKQQQDAVRSAVTNARITSVVAKVQEYMRKGRFEELAYRGISIQANEGLDSLGGPQELQRQLQALFGDVKVDYSTGVRPDTTSYDRPSTHTLKVSGGAIEEGIQRLREARVERIVDEVLQLIAKVNTYLTNSYRIPDDCKLDDAAQRLCVTKFAALGITVEYDENVGMYRETGNRTTPAPHYLRFDRLDMQAKLAEALANKLVEKITSSGNFDGPWTFANKDINGNNEQLPIEIRIGAQAKMGNGIQIDQIQDFYTKDRYLEIVKL